ncbi:MAG: EutN/CcmL family microcompartment protein [Planctomycetes bacterium]|nr:EutN/CcmL family microcompartment protein [Planctomycetota bacterium]
MILARVCGSVTSTVKNSHLERNRLLLVRGLDLDGRFVGPAMLALDLVDAGTGDTVLVVKEGGAARIAFDDPRIPLQLFVVGVVDRVALDPLERRRMGLATGGARA